jgi:hypothetical protein
MNKFLGALILGVISCLCPFVAAQESEAQKPTATDIDPLALEILKAATEPLKDAKAYSFRALVSHDLLGTNDQIITTFSTSEITVQRPNKLHIKFRGRGEPVDLFYDGSGKAVLYSASSKFYTTLPTPTTIDGVLADISKKGVTIAVRNFLESDPYTSLTDGLTTGYAVGNVDLFGEKVYHLAFTEPGAEWQVWVVSGDRPRVKRLEVIDRDKPHNPRIAVDFFDWDLNPTTSPDMFTFNKPADAREIEMLKVTAER